MEVKLQKGEKCRINYLEHIDEQLKLLGAKQ